MAKQIIPAHVGNNDLQNNNFITTHSNEFQTQTGKTYTNQQKKKKILLK
jgi:hypothetical protein